MVQLPFVTQEKEQFVLHDGSADCGAIGLNRGLLFRIARPG